MLLRAVPFVREMMKRLITNCEPGFRRDSVSLLGWVFLFCEGNINNFLGEV